MKKFILVIAVLTLSVASQSEDVGVNVDKIDTTQDTTISIKKGTSATEAKKKYSVVEGEHEVVGDKDVVAKAAEKKWKQECADWKKEFRLDNKDNKIISITCGRMVCDKEGVESTCKSQAKYKIKTISEE
jgi:hypothetical protein